MRPMYRQACSALAVLAWMTGPAAAQEPKRAEDLSREIEAQIEQHIELAARQLEHLVDNHLDDIIDEVQRAIEKHASKIEIKVQSKVAVLAQRQAGEAARREAQRAREVERRRREETRRGPEYTDKLSKTLRLRLHFDLDFARLHVHRAVNLVQDIVEMVIDEVLELPSGQFDVLLDLGFDLAAEVL